MKVLITGAAGFIGSHLTERCVELGYDVRVLIRYNSRNSWGWLEHVNHKNIEVICGDVRDYDSVYKAMKGCDTVFHLAALIGIPYSYVSPQAYIRTNIDGTYNVLEAGKNLELSNILITSTSETYGTAQFVPITEAHPLVGQSPYSATKIAADQLGISYYRSFASPVKIVRPFNTFGPRQSARAIIPTIITQLLQGNKNIKVGNLTPTRDFTFVKDTVNGFIEILKCDKAFGEVINVGMNTEISIKELISMIAAKLDTSFDVTQDDQRIRPDKSEVERLVCDNSKLLKLTQWKPKYNLSEGIDETIEWLKGNTKYYKPEVYNI